VLRVRAPGTIRLVACCGVVELVSWAGFYYTLPVLYQQIAVAEQWSTTALAAVFSGSMVVSALLSPRVGRAVDARGPRPVVGAGMAAGVCGLLTVAAAPNLVVLGLGAVLLGAAQAATLYPPIFAALTVWFGHANTAALTVVSVMGGLSSALAAPAMVAIAEGSSWRWAVVTVAGAVVGLGAPAVVWGLSGRWPVRTPENREVIRTLPPAVFTPGYRWLQVCLTTSGAALYGVTLTAIPLVMERGHSAAFAGTVFAAIGLGQVAGRLLFVPLSRWGSPRLRTTVQVTACAVATGALALTEARVGILAAALTAGAVRGAHILTVTTGLSERWGTGQFGLLSGHFQRPLGLAIAAAPFLVTALAHQVGSYAIAGMILAALTLLAVPGARRT
jgi:hypothetical protein